MKWRKFFSSGLLGCLLLVAISLPILGGKASASTPIFPQSFSESSYGVSNGAVNVCSITNLKPFPFRFSGNTTQWIEMTIKNTTASTIEDGIFIGEGAGASALTINGGYFIDGTGTAHTSLTWGQQSGTTYAYYLGDYGNTGWAAGTTAHWGINITASSLATVTAKGMYIAVHRNSVTGGTLCQMDMPVANQDSISSFASVIWSDACPTGSEGSYPGCSAPTSTIGGGSSGLTQAQLVSGLTQYFTPRVKESMALMIVAFLVIVIPMQFRWRSR